MSALSKKTLCDIPTLISFHWIAGTWQQQMNLSVLLSRQLSGVAVDPGDVHLRRRRRRRWRAVRRVVIVIARIGVGHSASDVERVVGPGLAGRLVRVPLQHVQPQVRGRPVFLVVVAAILARFLRALNKGVRRISLSRIHALEDRSLNMLKVH